MTVTHRIYSIFGIILLLSFVCSIAVYSQESPGSAPGARIQELRRRGPSARQQPPHLQQERGRPQHHLAPILEKMRNNNPEEFTRLQELRRNDPEQFRDEVRQKFQERIRDHGSRMREHSEQREKIRQLAENYHKAQTDAEREQVRRELKEKFETAFDKDLAMRRERITEMEKRLLELKKAVAQQEADKEAVCNDRLELILNKGKHDAVEEPEQPADE